MTDRRSYASDFYRDLMQSAPDAVYVHDLDGVILDANDAAVRQTGFRLEQLRGMAVGDLVSVKTTDEVLARCRDMQHSAERHRRFVSAHRRADGGILPVEVSLTRITVEQQDFFAAVVRDVTERERLQHQLEHRAVFHDLLLDISNRLVSLKPERVDRILDQALAEIGQFFRVDRAYIFSVDEEQRLISNTHEWVSEGTEPVNSMLKDAPFARFPWLMSRILRHRVAHVPDVEAMGESARIDRLEYQAQDIRSLVIVPMARRGGVCGMFGLDAVREKRFWPKDMRENLRLLAQLLAGAMESVSLSQRLLHLSQHDSLTELPNRQLLHDRINRGIARCRREGGLLAVLMLDLDDFKLVNDSMGHAAGDRLLRRVASRLHGLFGDSETVARLGGDEFVVVAQVEVAADAAVLADRIVDAVSQPVSLDRHPVVVHPSIGICVYPEDGSDSEALLRNSDTAMYAAKAGGKNRFAFFDASMNDAARRTLDLRFQLGHAIREHQLRVLYQPRVDLVSGRVQGFEALVRWQHPTEGLLLPEVFLGVAERSDLVCQIDRWVAHRACEQVRLLHPSQCVVMAVNLSPRDIYDPQQLAALMDLLASQPWQSGFSIEIEVTESMLMLDIETAVDRLRLLKQRLPDLRIAIDDFGSGYSSLNHLRRLPIDTLKIDGVFVRELDRRDSNGEAIVRSIMQLSQNLGLQVIAEGVETLEQYQALLALCRDGGLAMQAQGILFSEPVTPDKMLDMLSRRYRPVQ